MANTISNYFFRRRVKRVNQLARLVTIHEHRYYQLLHSDSKTSTKLVELNSKNYLLTDKDSEFSRKKAIFIILSPLFVAMIDVLLANVVLRELVSQLQLTRVFLTVLLVAVIIVFVEINLGLYLDRTDENENNMGKDNSHLVGNWLVKFRNFLIKSKIPILGFLAVLFVLIVPLISLSEFFAQKAVYMYAYSNGRMTAESYVQSITSLRLRYFGLSLMSFITHVFLVSFTKTYVSSWALFSYLRKKDKLINKMDTIDEQKKSVESDIVIAMIDYYQAIQLLKSDYPNLPVEKFPKGLFSENVIRLYESHKMINVT